MPRRYQKRGFVLPPRAADVNAYRREWMRQRRLDPDYRQQEKDQQKGYRQNHPIERKPRVALTPEQRRARHAQRQRKYRATLRALQPPVVRPLLSALERRERRRELDSSRGRAKRALERSGRGVTLKRPPASLHPGNCFFCGRRAQMQIERTFTEGTALARRVVPYCGGC